MAALTLTPRTADDKKVYSDGTISNLITVNVQSGGKALPVTKLTGTVSDSTGAYVGTVSTGVTTQEGDIHLSVGAPVSGTLTLTLYANAQSSGTMPLQAVLFQPVILTNDPPLAGTSKPVVVSARIVDATGIPVDGVPLSWQVLDRELAIAPTSATTQKGDPSSYQYTLRALTAAEIAALPTNRVHMELVIGPLAGGYTVSNVVPTQAPLLAPTLPVSLKTPPVIDDDLIDACEVMGVAFAVPAIADAARGEIITLAATSGPGATPRVLLLKPFDKSMIGGAFLMLVPTTNDVFSQNGPEFVYYTVTGQGGSTLATSEQLTVLVQRKHLPAHPDGNPDSRLTSPQVSPTVYAGDVQDVYLVVTINFDGAFQARSGDVVTTKLDLLGYTAANLNWIPEPPIPPIARTLTASNFDRHGRFIPFSVSFTPSQLAGIDGSNGQVYYTVEREQAATIRSPSTSIVVDTKPAYSGSIARMLAR